MGATGSNELVGPRFHNLHQMQCGEKIHHHPNPVRSAYVFNRVERLPAPLPLCSSLEPLERLAEAAGHNRLEQILLCREEPKHIRLRDAKTTCDVLDGCAMQPQLRELG